LKLKVEIELSTSFANLLEEDLIIFSKFSYLVSNIENEVYGVLNYFLPFLRKYEEKKKFIICFP
jgi:hypothetical protein